jgi:hypothetical protein
MNQEKRVVPTSRPPLQEKNKSFKLQATTNIQVRIGGRMRWWRKGEGVDLDEETVRQYIHPNDYEIIPKPAERKQQTGKTKEE